MRKKPPEFGYVHWDEEGSSELIAKSPEPLTSRFRVEFGMVLNLLQRPRASTSGAATALLIDLIDACHENAGRKRRLRQEAKQLFKQLREAKIIELRPRTGRRGRDVVVAPELQRDFSLHHSLSLFLVRHRRAARSRRRPDYAVQVLSSGRGHPRRPPGPVEAPDGESAHATPSTR